MWIYSELQLHFPNHFFIYNFIAMPHRKKNVISAQSNKLCPLSIQLINLFKYWVLSRTISLLLPLLLLVSENQILIPDWTYFHYPDTTRITNGSPRKVFSPWREE